MDKWENKSSILAWSVIWLFIGCLALPDEDMLLFVEKKNYKQEIYKRSVCFPKKKKNFLVACLQTCFTEQLQNHIVIYQSEIIFNLPCHH